MGIHTWLNVAQATSSIEALDAKIQNLEEEIVTYAIELNELLRTLNDWQKATKCDTPSDYEMMERSRND